jgi:hypothetical protein
MFISPIEPDPLNPFKTLVQGRTKPMAKTLTIRVTRDPKSLQYLKNPKKPFAWDNNDNNNSLDLFEILDAGKVIFSCKAQTVANMEGLDVPTAESPAIKFSNTIAPGPFRLKVGLDKLDPRKFYGRINGICNTKTLAGDVIGDKSTTTKDPARWLNHDWQKHKPNPAGVDTRVAWSAGCFIVPDKDLEAEGAIFDKYGYKPGDFIDGVLVMKV